MSDALRLCPECEGTGVDRRNRKLACRAQWCQGGRIRSMCDCDCHDQPGNLHIEACCIYSGGSRTEYLEHCRQIDELNQDKERLSRMTSKEVGDLKMILEVASIYLTDGPESTFTREQLISQAQEIGGEDFPIREDFQAVFREARFLEFTGDGRYRLR